MNKMKNKINFYIILAVFITFINIIIVGTNIYISKNRNNSIAREIAFIVMQKLINDHCTCKKK